jgi:hypothetical protein
VADELVVSGGDAPELLEPGEEALDAVAFLVEARVAGMFAGAVRPWGNDGLGFDPAQGVVEMVGVVGLVGDDGGGLETVEERGGLDDVASVAGCQDEADWKAEGVDAGVDLGSEAAPRAAKTLGLRPPLLRAAPAACAWALIEVESMATHSRSASWARAQNSRSRTPISIQR